MRRKPAKKLGSAAGARFRFEVLEPRHLLAVLTGDTTPPFEQPPDSDDPPLLAPQEAPPLDNYDWEPKVYAGPDTSVEAFSALQLNAEVLVNTEWDLTIEWNQLSGPGNAVFSNSSGVSSTVQFDQAGTYELEFSATNHGVTAAHSMFVTVSAANVINIDQAWLDAQGDGPYILKDAGKTYRLQDDVTTPDSGFYIANRDITLDLNGHTIHYGGNNEANTRGVILYLSWHNTEINIPGAAEAFNAVIKNGKVVNDGAGDRSHGIYGYRGNNATIENMEITVDGKDTHTVYFANQGTDGATIRDSILTTYTNSTFNRHAGPANVFINGRLVAEGNILIGGNSGFNVGANSVIHGNVIAQNSFATNGYGVFTYRTNNITITDNLILPTNGRGIMFNAGENHTATGNVILHMEPPNEEFGENLNPPAVRSRYETSGIVYSNNTSLGIGGGSYTSASSLYISSYGTGVSRYENNDATVILTGTPDINHYAQPVTLEGTGHAGAGTPGLDIIANNHLKSNYLMLRVEGYDGYTEQLEPLKGNTLDWVSGSTAYSDFLGAVVAKLSTLTLSADVLSATQSHIAAVDALVEGLIAGQGLQPNRAIWQTKYITHTGSAYVDVLDSNWGSGVDPKSYTYQYSNLSKGAVKMREGFTKQVRILNNGGPAANTVVDVSTEQGDSYQATTDANGFVTLTFYRFSIEKDEPVEAPFSVIDRTQSTITIGGNSVVVEHANVPNQIDLGAAGSGQSLNSTEQQSATLAAIIAVEYELQSESSSSTLNSNRGGNASSSHDAALEGLSSNSELLLLYALSGYEAADFIETTPPTDEEDSNAEHDLGFAYLFEEQEEPFSLELQLISLAPT